MFNFDTHIKPELVGLCSILVAAKYDENDPIFPYVRDLQTVYPRLFFMDEEINKCEIFVLQCLQYKLDHYTSSHFLQLMSLNGLVFSDDTLKSSEKLDKITIQRVYEKSQEILNFVLEEEVYLHTPHIYLALSAVLLSRQIYKFVNKFPTTFEQLYNIKLKDFSSYYEKLEKLYCRKNGIVVEDEMTTPELKKPNRKHTLLEKPPLASLSRDGSSSRNAEATTKPNSKLSSEIKTKASSQSREKKIDFLDKYLIRSNKDTSIHDLHKNIIYKLKRPININLTKEKKSSSNNININLTKEKKLSSNNINISKDKDSFELKFEPKNNRNIKRSLFEATHLYSIDEKTSRTRIPPHVKLSESRSLLLNTKDSSFLTHVSKNIDNIRSKLAKKLDYSTLNNSHNTNNVPVSNVSMGGVSLVKKIASRKTAFNIQTLLEMNNNKINLSNLSKI